MINGAVPIANDPNDIKFFTEDVGGRVFLHPSSVNTKNVEYESPWLVYLQMMETARVYAYDATMVHPYALLLFGGEVGVDHANGLVTVDKWIKFRATGRIAVLGACPITPFYHERHAHAWARVMLPHDRTLIRSPLFQCGSFGASSTRCWRTK
jgi:hypothetical protein